MDEHLEERNCQGLERPNTDPMRHEGVCPLARRLTLDIDSFKSPVHGAKEQAAYRGHAESLCCHPISSSTSRVAVWPPRTIQSWVRTSLWQPLFKTSGRLIWHARRFILRLAESDLTRRLFEDILGRIERLVWHPARLRAPDTE